MEKRDKERIATDDAVLFSIDDVVMRGTMRNITQDGCMIDGCSVTAEIGQKVEVTLPVLLAQALEVRGACLGLGVGVRFAR